jgi:general secretion pathway protein D
LDQALQKRGTVSFRETPLTDVIYTLSQQWNINIIAGSDITGTVSGSFHEAPLREILDSLLTVQGYGYRHNGGSLLVLKQEQIGPNNPNFRVETFLLPQRTTPEAATEVLNALKVFSTQNGGQIQSVPANNSILVFDTPDRIALMQQMFQKMLGPTPGGTVSMPNQLPVGSLPGLQLQGAETFEDSIITLRPQFIPASELAKGVQLALGIQANFVTIDGEQAIMVYGTPSDVRKASLVMSQLDKPRAQVRITSYVYDVALGEGEQSGIDWSSRVMSRGIDSNGIPNDLARNDSGLLTRVQPSGLVGNSAVVGAAAGGGATGGAAASVTGPTGPQWVFRSLGSNFELNTVLQALDETRGAKLLADPHVTVLDRQKASIDIITKIPIQQLTQTQQGGSIGTTAFEEAGIKLTVIPRVANDNTIQMEVTPEVSTLTGFSGSGNPIIDARRATTTVRVANQHTLVIGGLRQKSVVETVKGIPGLMNVKYIGRLFRSHNTELKESELIVFLQPEIVDEVTTGLPREQLAIEESQLQLSRIQPSCLGPHMPDCRDPNCPYHRPRKRIQRVSPDNGLIYPPISGTWDQPLLNEEATSPPPTAFASGADQGAMLLPSSVESR